MALHDKDIFVVIGASRTGKGTLLSGLMGQKLKLFKKNQQTRNLPIYRDAATKLFVMPEGPDGHPVDSLIISNKYNSHTLVPKLPQTEPKYIKDFESLNKTWLIDLPGMFDSRGDEFDITQDLTLQKLILSAKSAKILVLVSAQCLTMGSSVLIKIINERLGCMFDQPEKHIIIGITKNFMVEMEMDYDEVIAAAQGEPDRDISFRGYEHIIQVEPHKPDTLKEMIDLVNKMPDVKPFVK